MRSKCADLVRQLRQRLLYAVHFARQFGFDESSFCHFFVLLSTCFCAKLRAMLVLTDDDVRRHVPVAAVVRANEDAFRALHTGRATVPPRLLMEVDGVDGVSLFKPARCVASFASQPTQAD